MYFSTYKSMKFYINMKHTDVLFSELRDRKKMTLASGTRKVECICIKIFLC